MKPIFTLVLSLVSTICFAQVPSGYYSSADGLTGYTLKSELSQIITTGHTVQSYGDLWDAYYDTDRDEYFENDQSLLDIYSENPASADPYNFTLGSDQCGNYTGESSCYNREHLMPQSWFNSNLPMKTDVHHVYPTDGYVNGIRGHLPFGEVGAADFTSQNGSQRGNNTFPNAYTGTVFEPIDEFKGDIARVYFYMATRYEDQIGSWENVNDGSQNTLNGTSVQVFDDWMLEMLLQWHNQDPVSQKELDRNNASYIFQGNRNPFIDNPDYAAQIWNADPDTEAPSTPTNLTVQDITSTSVQLSWTASTDNTAVGNYEMEVDGEVVGTSESTTFTAENLSSSTSFDFQVFALDATQNRSEGSNSVSATTEEALDIIYFETFEDCFIADFTSVSELSGQDWQCLQYGGVDDSGSYGMNGYDSGQQVPSIDWLITNSTIDFSNYDNETLGFTAFAQFGNTALQLLYSEDYDGGGNPSNFTWESVPDLTIPLASGNAEESFDFNQIDLSSLPEAVYFAFRYDNSNGQDATRWRVDNFKLSGEENLSLSHSKDTKFSLYPNPAKTEFSIHQKNASALTYQIINLSGKQVKKGRINKESISVENLSAGIYFVRLGLGSNTENLKLIVE